MVDVREVDHLEGDQLLLEVVRLAEGDVELDAPEGIVFFPRTIP
jgi:hypothetical protein